MPSKPQVSENANGAPKRVRICLAASGGGHVRQLLDLETVWAQHDYFFVTEDTALGASLKNIHRTYFVPHFAWGQTKLGAPLRMIRDAFVSFFRSAAIIIRERPDVVISTGAGAVFPAVLWARLLGSKIVIVESFARFEHPSLFGRIAAPFAHAMVVQSPKLGSAYAKAHVFDPLKRLDVPTNAKADLLFATVGATLPFDRLVEMVRQLHSEGVLPQRVIVQCGIGGNSPDGMEVFETLPFERVQEILTEAAIVVCHGGTGSLITALRQGCHTISVPRLSRLGEHYDDHQSEITEAFVARGLVMSANNVDELRVAIAAAKTRERTAATTDPRELADFLQGFIGDVGKRRTA